MNLFRHTHRSSSPENGEAPPTTRRRSASPSSRGPGAGLPRVDDVDPVRRAEREKALAARLAAIELDKLDKGKEKEGTLTKAPEFDAKIGRAHV